MTNISDEAVEDQIAIIAELEGRARRFETPCEDGVIVWHSWGSGPPLLLVHGSHGSWSHWARNIDALAERHTLWVPDVPGYGESAMPSQLEHEALVTPLAAGLAELLGADLPIDVIGFSFGGTMAAHLVAHYPGVVRRLIIVGSGGLNIPVPDTIILQQIRGLEGKALEDVSRANLLALMLHDPASVDELALHIQITNCARGRLRPEGFVLPDRLLEVMPDVTVQLDAIWGECDAPHPPASHESALRAFHPDMEFVVIPGGGHWVPFECPEAFNRIALDMLAKPLR